MVEQIIMGNGVYTSNGLDFESIVPSAGDSFSEQVKSCVEQLSAFIYPEGESRFFVTQQTFFISTRDREEYDERSAEIRMRLSESCGALLPATCIVAQSPLQGSEVVLELICTRASEGKKVIYKTSDDLSYTVVEQDSYKVIHATGMMGGPGDSIQESSEKAFRQAEKILGKEGLSFRHIIRQWNYIENIAHIGDSSSDLQNYQVFNDVRTVYYNRDSFRSGYPAATGIGMDTGGVIIGLIAISDSDQVAIKPIRNPRQVDAHQYSGNVLKGRITGVSEFRCTPKFERGKIVSTVNRHHIYVSGTASIVGEQTMHLGDVGKQTRTTIENIYGLFSKENQKKLGIEFDIKEIKFSHLRVYVKHQEDIPIVMKICEDELNCKSSLFLVSDICREELLVEIEGIFKLADR